MKTKAILIGLLAYCMLFTAPAIGQIQVWPGDANNDGVVNTVDVLYLGLGFNTQGIARPTQGTIWQAYQATLWNNVILPDSLNYSYLDCNGNGFIDDNDLLAISQNYDSVHAGGVNMDSFPPANAQSPLFYFSNLPDSLTEGDTVTLDIFAGSNILPADFFGVTLTFNYDPALIVQGSVTALPDSTVNTPLERVLFLSNDDTAQGSLALAISRRANTGGTTGNPIVLAGQKLLSISFIIEDNLIGKTLPGPLVLSLSNIGMISKSAVKSSALSAQVSLPFAELVASTSPILQLPNLKIYPQPTSGWLIVEGLPEKGMLTVTDLSGKSQLQNQFTNGRSTLDCTILAAGLYLLHIETNEGRMVKKIMID